MEVGNSNNNTMIDETYEYSAPMFFDFVLGETDEEMETAQHWFETALSYAPSPFMPRIKESRTVQIESLCDFSDVEIVKKDEGPSNKEVENSTRLPEVVAATAADKRVSIINEISVAKNTCDDNSSSQCCQEKQSFNNVIEKAGSSGQDACTPELQKKTQTAKKIASLIQNPSTVKPIKKINLSLFNGVASSTGSAMTTKTCSKANGVPSSARSAMTTKTCSQANCVPSSARSAMITKTLKARSAITTKKTITAPDFTQDNQAIKRQKLEGGKSREILNLKLQNLTHNKSSLGVTNVASCSTSRAHREDRKLYVREEAVPFVSTAEMVRRFQSSTRDGSVFNESTHSSIQKKSKLTLTRPKEPDFETSHRVRSTRVKSSSELEEEMMANIPKFKARPVNKKILEAPTLQALPRSTPHPPEFQEFHLKTMERASQNSETSSVVSMESSQNNNKNNVWNPHKLTEPKTPRLETLIRARPSKAKTTEELEHEELEKIPKFKARPLDKRIFESKGGMGMFRIPKGHITKPQEFHFATDERIPPTKSVMDLFDKLSLNSESRYDPLPRITTPNPFHLNTEERGAEKERKFVVEIMERRLEEERARIPKATPYPYTTDYPVVPPKPEPKHCTKPEPFQLESLVRHEEEMQREMEERQRLEREEAQMRIFKAQPILKEDPLPVPEKERKPLTQVEEFALHVDHRAQDRAEFDKKIKEKEMQYKRYREESESAKLMEEEKALKQLRRTLVPHARPVPKFDNPFQPQKSSKETTKPKSPKLRVLQRKQRRTSVSASHMR